MSPRILSILCQTVAATTEVQQIWAWEGGGEEERRGEMVQSTSSRSRRGDSFLVLADEAPTVLLGDGPFLPGMRMEIDTIQLIMWEHCNVISTLEVKD